MCVDLFERWYRVGHPCCWEGFRISATQLNFDLVPIQGSLYLTSSPSRANIFIDGKSFGKTPKEIKKIKLTDSIKITLKLDNFIDQEILFRPQSEKRENQNIKLERGQGFLKIMHDGDSEKIIVYSNNILLGKLSKYRNDTIVLDAGKNEIKLKKNATSAIRKITLRVLPVGSNIEDLANIMK